MSQECKARLSADFRLWTGWRRLRLGPSTWEKQFNRRERRERKEKQALESTASITRQMNGLAASNPLLCDLCDLCG
jgi:hypothetical protein